MDRTGPSYHIYIHAGDQRQGETVPGSDGSPARPLPPSPQGAYTPVQMAQDSPVEATAFVPAAGAVALLGVLKSAVRAYSDYASIRHGNYSVAHFSANVGSAVSLATHPVSTLFQLGMEQMRLDVANDRIALERELLGESDVTQASKGV